MIAALATIHYTLLFSHLHVLLEWLQSRLRFVCFCENEIVCCRIFKRVVNFTEVKSWHVDFARLDIVDLGLAALLIELRVAITLVLRFARLLLELKQPQILVAYVHLFFKRR